MPVATYTKSGTKATTATKLDKTIFGVEIKNHDLLQQAYLSYLARARSAGATAKTRGEVRGGGRKPWRQKGTGRARFGSSRNPIWRGGGIAFGPTGHENYRLNMSTQSKRQALRQALSLAATDDKIKILETFESKEGKVKPTVNLLRKLEANGSTLLVVSLKDELVERATRNIPKLIVTTASYLNVYDVLNADTIIMSQKSLEVVNQWLGVTKSKTEKSEVNHE